MGQVADELVDNLAAALVRCRLSGFDPDIMLSDTDLCGDAPEDEDLQPETS